MARLTVVERQHPGPVSTAFARNFLAECRARGLAVVSVGCSTDALAAPSCRGVASMASPTLALRWAERLWLDAASRDELRCMEDGAKSERDKLILRLLADCGPRMGELVGLRMQDLWEPRRG